MNSIRNIVSIDPIINAVDKVLREKQINDERIRTWFIKTEKKFFETGTHEIRVRELRPYFYKDGDEEWKKNAYEIEEYSASSIDALKHVIDYIMFKGERYISKLYKKTWQDMDREIEDWDAELANSNCSINKNDLIVDTDYKIIHEFDNGYKIIMALSARTCQYEGEAMGHCAKNESYQCKPKSIISLWDRGNNPHVTMELNPPGGKTICQIKGKQNAAPVDKYKPFIIDFIQSKKYKVTGDGQNIGMISYDNVFYFKDSKEFNHIYETVIVPKQKATIDALKAEIERKRKEAKGHE